MSILVVGDVALKTLITHSLIAHGYTRVRVKFSNVFNGKREWSKEEIKSIEHKFGKSFLNENVIFSNDLLLSLFNIYSDEKVFDLNEGDPSDIFTDNKLVYSDAVTLLDYHIWALFFSYRSKLINKGYPSYTGTTQEKAITVKMNSLLNMVDVIFYAKYTEFSYEACGFKKDDLHTLDMMYDSFLSGIQETTNITTLPLQLNPEFYRGLYETNDASDFDPNELYSKIVKHV